MSSDNQGKYLLIIIPWHNIVGTGNPPIFLVNCFGCQNFLAKKLGKIL